MLLNLKDSKQKESLTKWWQELKENKGGRAQLRRCKSPLEICFQPAYHKLRQDLKITEGRLPDVAGLLAHVENNLPGNIAFAEQLATTKKNESQAKLSSLRFRRLLAITDVEQFYVTMIRVLRLLDCPINIESFAHDIYFWGSNSLGDEIRRNWAIKYYEKAPE